MHQILYIEDDQNLRSSVVEALKKAGHEVFAFGSGEMSSPPWSPSVVLLGGVDPGKVARSIFAVPGWDAVKHFITLLRDLPGDAMRVILDKAKSAITGAGNNPWVHIDLKSGVDAVLKVLTKEVADNIVPILKIAGIALGIYFLVQFLGEKARNYAR